LRYLFETLPQLLSKVARTIFLSGLALKLELYLRIFQLFFI
jgi:hypothetical protein